MAKKKTKTIYQIKITLKDIKPPIWRRLLVEDNLTLFELQNMIQISMGWTNTHLHQFVIGNDYYSIPHEDDFEVVLNEKKFNLKSFSFREKDKFQYEYDFGDGWRHEVLIEKIFMNHESIPRPLCIAGKRACPPEDCGGPWGYQDILYALNNPDDKEYDEQRDWVGSEYDPNYLDLDFINDHVKDINLKTDYNLFWV